jgi:hypothetical protein
MQQELHSMVRHKELHSMVLHNLERNSNDCRGYDSADGSNDQLPLMVPSQTGRRQQSKYQRHDS